MRKEKGDIKDKKKMEKKTRKNKSDVIQVGVR